MMRCPRLRGDFRTSDHAANCHSPLASDRRSSDWLSVTLQAWLRARARSCAACHPVRPRPAQDHTGSGCPSRTRLRCRNICRAVGRYQRSRGFAHWPAAQFACAARRQHEPPRKARGSGSAGIPRVGPRRDEQGEVSWPWPRVLSMIVHDLDLLRPLIAPSEYDPPLIVYSDRMLPARSPRKASSRLPGGATRSPSIMALLSCTSFRRATLATSVGNPFGTRRCWKINAANVPRKLLIIIRYVSWYDTKSKPDWPAEVAGQSIPAAQRRSFAGPQLKANDEVSRMTGNDRLRWPTASRSPGAVWRRARSRLAPLSSINDRYRLQGCYDTRPPRRKVKKPLAPQ